MVDVDRIRSVIEPVVEGLDLTVVRVAWGRSGRSGKLRIDVDEKRAGPVPVPYPGSDLSSGSLDEATREISAVLDVHDLVPGSYTLEVSTPGLDRWLRVPEDLEDFSGHPVTVVVESTVEGKRRISGTLRGTGEHDGVAHMVVEEAGRTWTLDLDNVRKVNLKVVIEGFPKGPTHGKGGKRKKR